MCAPALAVLHSLWHWIPKDWPKKWCFFRARSNNLWCTINSVGFGLGVAWLYKGHTRPSVKLSMVYVSSHFDEKLSKWIFTFVTGSAVLSISGLVSFLVHSLTISITLPENQWLRWSNASTRRPSVKSSVVFGQRLREMALAKGVGLVS